MLHENNEDINCSRSAWKGPQRLKKKKREEETKIRRLESIQTTALLRISRILKRVLDSCHSDTRERPPAIACKNNSQK